MSAKLSSVVPAARTQTFLNRPAGRAPSAPAPRPDVTHAQLLEAFNATLEKPEDPQLMAKFMRLFVDAKDPNFKDEGNHALHVAVNNFRLDLVRAFVANKKYVCDVVDEFGETALYSASATPKSATCPDPLAFVTELLKVVPVNKVNLKGETVEAYLRKYSASAEKRNPNHAKYLRETILPVIQAKIAEEKVAFEAAYQKRLAPVMRRIDQSEVDGKAHLRTVLIDPKAIASHEEKIHLQHERLRVDLPDNLRSLMENKLLFEMLTDPQKIEKITPMVEEISRLFEQGMNRLPDDPLEGKNRQLSSSPTGSDNDGSLFKM